MAALLARTTGVLFRLARTPVDPLHLARQLEDDSASPDGWRTTHPTPKGYTLPRPTPKGYTSPRPTPKGYTAPRPTPEGWARPRPTPEGRLYLIQRPMTDLASPDIRRLAPSHLTNRALRTLMMTATV